MNIPVRLLWQSVQNCGLMSAEAQKQPTLWNQQQNCHCALQVKLAGMRHTTPLSVCWTHVCAIKFQLLWMPSRCLISENWDESFAGVFVNARWEAFFKASLISLMLRRNRLDDRNLEELLLLKANSKWLTVLNKFLPWHDVYSNFFPHIFAQL